MFKCLLKLTRVYLQVFFLMALMVTFPSVAFSAIDIITGSNATLIKGSYARDIVMTPNGNLVCFYYQTTGFRYKILTKGSNAWSAELTFGATYDTTETDPIDVVSDISNNLYLFYPTGSTNYEHVNFVMLTWNSVAGTYSAGTSILIDAAEMGTGIPKPKDLFREPAGNLWAVFQTGCLGITRSATANTIIGPLVIQKSTDGITWNIASSTSAKRATTSLLGTISTNSTMITTNSSSLTNFYATTSRSGMIRIDNEWIGYIKTDGSVFTNCIRSLFGPATRASTTTITINATSITTANDVIKAGFTPAGTVIIDGECITYTGVSNLTILTGCTRAQKVLNGLTLKGGIASGATAITVNEEIVGAGYRPYGLIRIDSEIIYYGLIQDISDNKISIFSSLTRGVYGTTAVTHTTLTTIVQGEASNHGNASNPIIQLDTSAQHVSGAEIYQTTMLTCAPAIGNYNGYPMLFYMDYTATNQFMWTYFNGSTWSAPATLFTAGSLTANSKFSATNTDDGQLHVSFWDSYDALVKVFHYNGSWASETAATSTTALSYVYGDTSLTTDGKDLYCFYKKMNAAKQQILYTKGIYNGSSWSWGTESSVVTTTVLTTAACVMDTCDNTRAYGMIPIVYEDNSASTFTLKSEKISTNLLITTITPAHIQELTALTITITGSGFFGSGMSASVTNITIGTTAITNYTTANDTKIGPISIPATFSTGSYDLIIKNNSGTSYTNASKYVFTTGPTVTSLNPSSGLNIALNTITIIGTGFFAQGSTGAVTGITLLDTDLSHPDISTFTGFTAVSDTEIDKAVVPTGVKPGTYNVKVTSTNGTNVTSSIKFVSVGIPPTVTNVVPAVGSNLTITTINISGTNFYAGTTSPLVSFIVLGDSDFSSIGKLNVTINDSTISGAVVPASISAGTYNIRVTTLGGENTTSTQTFAVTTALPAVTNVQPTFCTDLNPATITITGTGFFAGYRSARVSAVQLSDFVTPASLNFAGAVISNTQIAGAVVPAGVAGSTYNVLVSTNGGTNATSAGGLFTVKAGPVVANVTPASNSNLSNATLTITGSSFFGGGTSLDVLSVKLDDSATTVLTITGADIGNASITGAILPAGVAVGTYNVKVTNLISTNNTSAVKFAVSTAAPTVVTITPGTGKGSVATTVTITGTGFWGGLQIPSVSAVKLVDGALSALDFSHATISDTDIKGALIPQGVTIGSYNVRVFTPGGDSGTSGSKFTITTPDPLVYTVTPSSGSNLIVSGTTITIGGYGFYGGISAGSSLVSTLKLVETSTQSLTVALSVAGGNVIADTTISGIIVPWQLPVGSYDIRVTTNSGAFNTTSAQKYRITTTAPTVVSLSPATVNNTASSTLTVYGTGFFGGVTSKAVTAIKISDGAGTLLTIPGTITDTVISGAILPAGAAKGTYEVVVTAAGGLSSGGASVTVGTTLPTVTAVNPGSGLNLNLTTLTLTGSGFSGGTLSNNTVTSIMLDDLELTNLDITGVTVVDGLISGAVVQRNIYPGTYNVRVTADGGTNTSSAKYTVTAPPPLVTSTYPSYGGDSGYRTLSISGSGFFAGLRSFGVSAIQIDDNLGHITPLDLPVSSGGTDSDIYTAIVPPGVVLGTYEVKVTTPGGTNLTSQEKYSVFPGARVTGLNPATGTTLSPTTLTISGLNFFSGSGSPDISSINIDNSAKTALILSAAVITDTEIKRAVLPANMAAGTYNVLVTTSLGSNLTSSVKLVVLENEASRETTPGSDYTINIYPVSARVQLYLEQNTFGEGVKVTLTSKGVTVPVKDRDTIKLSTIGYEVKLNKNIQPLKKVKMAVRWDSDLTGFDESKLVLMRYDDDNARWIVLQTTVNQTTNEATAYTDHFSKFVLGQLVPAINLANAKVYPNPFNPNRTYLTGGMLFDALTAAATVQLYSISGEKIWEGTDEDGDGRVLWDGRNQAGKMVAGGIYIGLIKGNGEVKRLKVAVER